MDVQKISMRSDFSLKTGYMVAIPARGQLNKEKCFFPCPRLRLRIWSRETGLAVPSRASLLIILLTPKLNIVLTHEIPPLSATASTYRYRQQPSGQSSLSGHHANASRWCSLPRVHWHSVFENIYYTEPGEIRYS